MLSMCIVLTIFDVSIEDERVYGILCIELFPQQRSHKIALEILCDMGLIYLTSNNSKRISDRNIMFAVLRSLISFLIPYQINKLSLVSIKFKTNYNRLNIIIYKGSIEKM